MRKPSAGAKTPARDQGVPPDRRDRHGHNRGLPPPASFSLASLPDDALLTEFEVASIGRWSTSTVLSWRQQPGHPLRWRTIHGGRVRYTAGDLRAFLSLGAPRPRKRNKLPPAAGAPEGAPERRRARRAKADDPTTVREQA